MTAQAYEVDEQQRILLSLLTPFPPEQVGKLPRVTCNACSDRRQKCEEHKTQRCKECGAYVSTRHIHIDYVGHADVTARLLSVDPLWQWEPAAWDEDGLPKVDVDDVGNPVGMWIRLTVAGMTRLGYGSCPSRQSDAIKVLIGDAIRNAAMRFGVALDLWSKSERVDPSAENAVADGGQRAAPRAHRVVDAAVQVDENWLAEFEKRLAESTLDNVNGFRQDVIDAVKTGRINSETANRLLPAIKERAAWLDEQSRIGPDGLPRRADGHVARSKVTDEQLEAAGHMTGPQLRAHNKFVKEVTSNPNEIERVPGPLPADQWSNGDNPAHYTAEEVAEGGGSA